MSAVGPVPRTALENRQRGFDFYSWLTFIALNSPSDGSGIASAQPYSRTKREDTNHFIQLLDVMRSDGNEPTWDNSDKTQIIPQACRGDYTPGMMVIQMIEETFNQPFKTGPLIDQRRNFALFDILMNKPMFDYIKTNHLYRKAGQMSDANAKLKVDFPAGINPLASSPNSGDPGSIMLKVSWKLLDPEDDHQSFHTVDAIVIMPKSHDQHSDPPCSRKTLGMVGLHIVHKTVSRLQWIWTSFEHVDNVPEQEDVDANNLKRSYNFYDPSCSKQKCPPNETPPRPWDPDPALNLKFHGSFNSQIVRVVPLTDDTNDINRKFRSVLDGTVWKNYILVSTQWPSAFPCAQQKATAGPLPQTDFEKEPDMTCAPAPTYLANSTLETYSQGKVPLASSTCMGCHANATSYQQRSQDAKPGDRFFNQSDFTFILEKAP